LAGSPIAPSEIFSANPPMPTKGKKRIAKHHSDKRSGKPPSALAKAVIPCNIGWEIDGQLASEDTPFS